MNIDYKRSMIDWFCKRACGRPTFKTQKSKIKDAGIFDFPVLYSLNPYFGAWMSPRWMGLYDFFWSPIDSLFNHFSFETFPHAFRAQKFQINVFNDFLQILGHPKVLKVKATFIFWLCKFLAIRIPSLSGIGEVISNFCYSLGVE